MVNRVGLIIAFRNPMLDVLAVDGQVSEDRVSFENRDFEPPDPNTQPPDAPSMWVRETLSPGRESLIATNVLELVGQIQYDVFSPLGRGAEKTLALAKLICEKFKPTVGLLSADGTVQISVMRSEVLGGMDGRIGNRVWYQVPVRVTFRAYASNNE